jgi:hypothetical protein
LSFFLAVYSASTLEGNLIFMQNQFIYSPNKLFALGISNYTMGIYNAYTNGSIGFAIWQPFPNSVGGCLTAQFDGNVVL